MIVANAIDAGHYTALFEELEEGRKTGVPTGITRRAAVIVEADDVQARMLAAGQAAAVREASAGAGWKWIAGLLVVGGAAAWLFLRPAGVPARTDPAVTASLNNMFQAANGASGKPIPKLPSGEEVKATIAKVGEAGYAAGSRLRGCKGVVAMGGVEEPYGFTIALNSNRGSDFTVAGASAEMIDARYGNAACVAGVQGRDGPGHPCRAHQADERNDRCGRRRHALTAAFADRVATMHGEACVKTRFYSALLTLENQCWTMLTLTKTAVLETSA